MKVLKYKVNWDYHFDNPNFYERNYKNVTVSSCGLKEL